MKQSRYLLPILTILPFGALSQNSLTQNDQSKPNVIFIYADDIGFGDLSYNGVKTIKTPNVESLARQGIRFTNMHSSAATCTPSRYALPPATGFPVYMSKTNESSTSILKIRSLSIMRKIMWGNLPGS